MNRQVGPSFVLSVLIVCFFAVALFEHAPPGSPGSPPQKTIREASERSRRSAAPATDQRSPRPEIEARQVSVARRDTSRPSIALAPGTVEPPAAHASSPPVPAMTASSRPAQEPLRPSGKSVSPTAAYGKHDPARESLSPFTVVRKDETIWDVALRIYGTTDGTDALWRANRDAIPRIDSPLAPGMLLRTPPSL